MGDQAWSMPADPEEAARRAGGRRHYNAVRKVRAVDRLKKLLALVESVEMSLTRRGFQANAARQLGVSRSTVCRDMKRLMALGNGPPHRSTDDPDEADSWDDSGDGDAEE